MPLKLRKVQWVSNGNVQILESKNKGLDAKVVLEVNQQQWWAWLDAAAMDLWSRDRHGGLIVEEK